MVLVNPTSRAISYARPRRLVDLLHLEAGDRVGFVDDPTGEGARLAGELLGRQPNVYLYGLVVADHGTQPHYDDETFDLIVSASGPHAWPTVSESLPGIRQLVRPGGTVAVSSTYPLAVFGRGLRTRPRVDWRWLAAHGGRSRATEGAHDAHDAAVGHQLLAVFGSAVRAELGTRVVWRATRRVRRS